MKGTVFITHADSNCRFFRFVGQVRYEDRCSKSWRLVNYITEMCLDNTSETMTGVIVSHTQSDCTTAMAHRKHAALTLARRTDVLLLHSASTQSQCSDSLSNSDRFHLVFKCFQLEKQSGRRMQSKDKQNMYRNFL